VDSHPGYGPNPQPRAWSRTAQRWWPRRIGLGLLVLVCLSVLFGTSAWSDHIPQLKWMAPYRAADGASCCGINDCFKAQVTLMSEPVNERVRVRVTSLEDWAHRQFWINAEVIVPQSSIHRSQDEHSWYCSNRHFQTWNVFGETTNQICYSHESYDVRTECVRCIFLNVGA
jgi:hypothetical protein